jgi:hypothetical protein
VARPADERAGPRGRPSASPGARRPPSRAQSAPTPPDPIPSECPKQIRKGCFVSRDSVLVCLSRRLSDQSIALQLRPSTCLRNVTFPHKCCFAKTFLSRSSGTIKGTVTATAKHDSSLLQTPTTDRLVQAANL